MKAKTINQAEMKQYKFTIPNQAEIIKLFDEFLGIEDRTQVLMIELDDGVSTERQRIKKLVSMFPRFEVMNITFKVVEKIAVLFATLTN